MFRLKVVREQVPTTLKHYGERLNNPSDVAFMAQDLLYAEDQEVVLAFFITAQSEVVGYTEVARGCIDACMVDLRIVFRAALMCGGVVSFVLAHCHPTNHTEPSKQDDTLTLRLIEAGRLLGLPLIDHVIVGSDCPFYSYARHGRIDGVNL